MGRRGKVLAALLALLGAGAGAPTASAYLYWATNSSIGRSNNDGRSPISLVTASGSSGVAVDGSYVYWAAGGNDRIGRARLDGTGADPNFITTKNITDGVVVDGSHIYWADAGNVSVGRANLDGSGVVDPFITGTNTINGVAVDAHHIYWTNYNGGIGRANLDGTGVTQSFIGTPGFGVIGLAVDGGHIYWTDSSGIGRASLDGSDVNAAFVADPHGPGSLAVDGQYLYWVNEGDGTIGRANLDGSGVIASLVPTAVPFRGIAVDGLPAGAIGASPTSLAFGSQPLGLLSPPQTLTIRNAKFGATGLGAASVTGANADDFTITSDTCSTATLWIDRTCSIGIRFAPSATGARSAALSLPSDDPAGPLTVPLGGTGGTLPQGPRGPAGRLEVITCMTVSRRVKGHTRKVRRCTGRLVSGTVRFVTATSAPRVTLVRGRTVYATGTEATVDGRRGQLVIEVRRPLATGSYTLIRRARRGVRWVSTRTAVTYVSPGADSGRAGDDGRREMADPAAATLLVRLAQRRSSRRQTGGVPVELDVKGAVSVSDAEASQVRGRQPWPLTTKPGTASTDVVHATDNACSVSEQRFART